MWTVEWKPVGEGGIYLFSRDGVPSHHIAHRQCDTFAKFLACVSKMEEQSWWDNKLAGDFWSLFEDGQKFRLVRQVRIFITFH